MNRQIYSTHFIVLQFFWSIKNLYRGLQLQLSCEYIVDDYHDTEDMNVTLELNTCIATDYFAICIVN